MASNTIILEGDPMYKKAKADGAITPGHLLEKGTDSGDMKSHSTSGGNNNRAFAVEDSLQGNGIDDDYSDNNEIKYAVCQRGVEVYAILTTSQTISDGDALESAGDGTLQKHTPPDIDSTGAFKTYTGKAYYDSLAAYAREAVTTTSSTARIKIEVA